MPLPSEIPRPLNEQDFERMCADIYGEVYKSVRPQMYGRRGQKQSGIDVLLHSEAGLIGLQAKKRTRLDQKELERDIEASDAMAQPLSLFLVVTTAPSDRYLLDWAETLSYFRQQAGFSHVGIEFWDDVCMRIRAFPRLKKYDVRSPEVVDAREHKRLSDTTAIRQLFSKLNLGLLNDHLRNFPSYYRYDVAVMFDNFMEAYMHPRIRFHDQALRKLFHEFVLAWERAMPADGMDVFEDTAIPGLQRFQSTGAQYRLTTFRTAPLALKKLTQAVSEMYCDMNKLLDYVHKRFPDVNVDELGEPLGRELNEMMRSFRT